MTRAVPFPPWGGSEHCPSCSLHPRPPCTAPVLKLPVPPTPRTASACRVPELARKSTCTGTAQLLPLLGNPAHRRAEATEARDRHGTVLEGRGILPQGSLG